MGISVSAIIVSDDQIREFERKPSRAEELCNSIIPHASRGGDCLRLFSNWRDVHEFLVRWKGERELPFCCLKRGDVRFSPVEDPTWAIYSSNTRILAEELGKLMEERIREISLPMGQAYVKEIKRRKNAGATVLEDVSPEYLWEQAFKELIEYLTKFRNFAARAAEEGNGLMFCQYEDW